MKKSIIEYRYLRSLYQLENLYETYFILFFLFFWQFNSSHFSSQLSITLFVRVIKILVYLYLVSSCQIFFHDKCFIKMIVLRVLLSKIFLTKILEYIDDIK